MKELSKEINIPVSDLVQPFESRNRTINGTWVHPQMAINLAQWASPKLAVLVPQWVFLWMSEQSTDVKESPVENPKNKFDDYDPNFKRLIQKAIAYDPVKEVNGHLKISVRFAIFILAIPVLFQFPKSFLLSEGKTPLLWNLKS